MKENPSPASMRSSNRWDAGKGDFLGPGGRRSAVGCAEHSSSGIPSSKGLRLDDLSAASVGSTDRCALVSAADRRDAFQFDRAGQLEGSSRVVFMFPGGGTQYPGMGRDLYLCEPIFRAEIDQCARLARKFLPTDLREILYGDEEDPEELQRPPTALAALFSTEYALARLWISWGVTPGAMIGHSVGEYVAACLAGVFSLREAIGVVVFRGSLFERVGSGAMLSVPMAVEALDPLLDNRLSVAAVNGPSLCVVSGAVCDIEELEQKLMRMGVNCQRLPIAVPAHSVVLDPVLDDFERELAVIHFRRPKLRLVSNVTGTWIRNSEATDPMYWVRHLRQTVRFADGIATLMTAGYRAMLELGPGRSLTSLALLQASGDPGLIVPTMRRRHDSIGDVPVLQRAVAQLRLAGQEVRIVKPLAV